MLDRDLAELYGVPTKRLNEQVKRNARRFPASFMFQLTKAELEDWRSQIATSNLEQYAKKCFAFASLDKSNIPDILANSNPRRLFPNLPLSFKVKYGIILVSFLGVVYPAHRRGRYNERRKETESLC